MVEVGAAVEPHLTVGAVAWELALAELPISIRLRSVCNVLGARSIGDLNGVTHAQLMGTRYCGCGTLRELRALVQRASSGEFSAAPETDFSGWLAEVMHAINAESANLPDRAQMILERRFGCIARSESLAAIAWSIGYTGEAMRAIIRRSGSQILKGRGPRLARAIRAIEEHCEQHNCALTAALFEAAQKSKGTPPTHSADYYLHVLRCIAPHLPVCDSAKLVFRRSSKRQGRRKVDRSAVGSCLE